jgi:hypothetical protein
VSAYNVLKRHSEAITDVSIDRQASWEEFRSSRRLYRARLRQAKILIRSFFVGQERDILMLLATSATPIADIRGLWGLCMPEAHRHVKYLRRILVEYLNYFCKKRTYKQATSTLQAILSPTNYLVFTTYLRCRDATVESEVLGVDFLMIHWRLRRIDKILKASVLLPGIRDLFVLWRRLGKIRKTYYGRGKKRIMGPELEKPPEQGDDCGSIEE